MIEEGLRVGLIGEAIATVTQEQTAIEMGSGAFYVFATPAMIALMESAAVSAIAPYLPDTHASVGVEVNIQHLSATPIGEAVTAMAEVTKVDGQRVHLQIRAWDDHELIGIGTHVRVVIDIEGFEERVQRDDSLI